MIPNMDYTRIGQDVAVETAAEQPTLTHRINFATGRIGGFVEGRDAVRQAIMMILQTERFKYLIYSWNYGTELSALYGKSYPVVQSEMRRVLREALLEDRRITDLTDLEVQQLDKRTVAVSFTAVSVFGDVRVEDYVMEVAA